MKKDSWLCNAKCETCKYRTYYGSHFGLSCAYILHTGKRRKFNEHECLSYEKGNKLALAYNKDNFSNQYDSELDSAM